MIKIKCQLCGELVDTGRICRECGASVPPGVYQEAKEAGDTYKEFPAVFRQLESYKTVNFASVGAATELYQKCSELLRKLAGFESFIQDDFNALKAKTAALNVAVRAARKRKLRGEIAKNLIAVSASLFSSVICLYLAYNSRTAKNLMDVFIPVLINGAVLGFLMTFLGSPGYTTRSGTDAAAIGVVIGGIPGGIAGIIVAVMGGAFVVGRGILGGIVGVIVCIIGAIAGALSCGIAGTLGAWGLNKKGKIGGGIAGAISGAMILGTVIFGILLIAQHKTDDAEGLAAFVLRGGVVAMLLFSGVVFLATRPSEPVPLKTKAMLTGAIGLLAAIVMFWKYTTVYAAPDGVWEFGRMMRITISGNDFTFSTKETGAFVDTNEGTVQIEDLEKGKAIAFAVTGGMSESGEWARSSGEPQMLVGSLSEDGKSLTLDELAYTKKWNVVGGIVAFLDDIFTFLDGKENAESENAEPAAVRVVVSANSANFREGPSAGAQALKTLQKGDTLTVTGDADNGWLPVEHDGAQGYVSENLLSAAPAPVPTLFGGRPLPGLYTGSVYRGYMDLSETMDWIAENVEDGGAYSIVLGKNCEVSDMRLDYGGRQATVSLKATGAERFIGHPKKNSDSPLFTVMAGATLTLEDGMALSGWQNKSNRALVVVDGGTFIMNGGKIVRNTANAGGGVQVLAGTFAMNGGAVSDNAAAVGGGVYIGDTGTFTMNGGTIGGNTASGSDSYGGGVYVDTGGAFTMTNGSISGNNSGGNGGGVSVRPGGTFAMRGGSIGGNTAVHGAGVHGNLSTGGTFTKTGGVIYGSNAPDEQKNRAGQSGQAVFMYISDSNQKTRDATAGENTALDSSRNGAAGGWGR